MLETPAQAVPKSNRPVFRAGALRAYVRGREEAILPHFVSRRAIGRIWLAIALVGIAIGALLASPISLIADGTVLVSATGAAATMPERHVLAIAVPANLLPLLREGGAVYLGPSRRAQAHGQLVALASPLPRTATLAGDRTGGRVVAARFPVDVTLPTTTEACRAYKCRVRIEAGRVPFWRFLFDGGGASARRH